MRVEDRANGATRTQRRLRGIERLGARGEHVSMAPVHLARERDVHERGVVMPVGGGELERHLIGPSHRAVAGVVTDEERLLAAAHRPSARTQASIHSAEHSYPLPD